VPLSFEQLNTLLALGTVALQIATVILFLFLFLRKKSASAEGFSVFISRWGLLLSFLLTLAATALTLYYSEVLGFVPCGLCWLQRIFLYPLPVLFAVALWKKENRIADYAIVLSVFGALVALYQHYLQMGGTDVLPCPATGATADCSVRILLEFGYITFPLMAFSIFVFLIALMLHVRRESSTVRAI